MNEASTVLPQRGQGWLRGSFRGAVSAVRRELEAMLSDDPWVLKPVLAFVLLELAGAFWDMPASYGWENDGAAPRDLFGGIANNLTPGQGHRYPLFHYLVLGFLVSPVLLLDVLLATLSGTRVIDIVVSVPSMTAIAVIAKLTHIAMMSVALFALARVFRNLFSVTAGRLAVLFAMVNLSIVYYGRATNTDGPYLMWTALAIDRITLLAKSGRFADYAWFAVFVAASMATKDQAYASYVLSGPLFLIALPLAAPGALAAGRQHWAHLSRALVVGAVSYAVLSGAVFNPSGFLTRYRLLTGTNSQDWKTYESSAAGWLQNVLDIASHQADYWWPWPLVAVAWGGVLLILKAQPRARLAGMAWRALPLCAGISSTVAFTLVVGRDAHRFVLPLGFWLSGYAGASAAFMLESAKRRPSRALIVGSVGLLFGLGLSYVLELLVTQWNDPRRDVERFLAALPPGSQVETYGLGVYLPRFDLSSASNYSVTHVRAEQTRRPPLFVGMRAIVDSYARVTERAPDVLVIPEAFAERFLERSPETDLYRTQRKAMQQYLAADGAIWFFPAAREDDVPGYDRLPVGEVELPGWYRALGGRVVQVHGSTGRSLWVLQRRDGRAPLSL